MARNLTSIEEYRRLVASAISEDDLLIDVAQRLTLGRWRWHHIRRSDQAGQMGNPGFPDLIAVRAGELLVAELKGPKTPMGTGQTEWLDAFRRGVTTKVRVWRPGDIDEITELLR